MTIISILFFCVSSFAVNRPDVILQNNKAIEKLSENQTEAAKENLLKALEKDPSVGELYLNLGAVELAGQDLEKAREVSELTLKQTDDPKVKALALYNLGLIAQLEKKKDLALSYYQQSLELEPINKSASLNIELLTQKNQKGGGGGDGEQKDENQDQKDDPEKEFKQASRGKAPKPQFNSQELTPGDVSKIMEELKRQEKKVRAEFQKGQTKEAPRDKDW